MHQVSVQTMPTAEFMEPITTYSRQGPTSYINKSTQDRRD
jgi:hypothetical protein